MPTLSKAHTDTLERALEPVLTLSLPASKPGCLLTGMEWLYSAALARLSTEYTTIKWGEMQHAATTLAICIDKIQLLKGLPTDIFAGIVDMRHSLPMLASRLSTISVGAGVPTPLASTQPARVLPAVDVAASLQGASIVPQAPGMGESGSPGGMAGVGTGLPATPQAAKGPSKPHKRAKKPPVATEAPKEIPSRPGAKRKGV